jgi:hypothetical protein
MATSSAPVPVPSGAVLQDIQQSQPDQPGWLDKEIPLDSYTHATESGLQSIGRGIRGSVQGTMNLLDPRPKDDTEQGVSAAGPGALQVYRILRSLGHTATDAGYLAGAIHDINQSPDPLGTYAKVAQETSGEGAGQALAALATEGATRAIPAAIKSPTVRATAGATADIAKGGAELADVATFDRLGKMVDTVKETLEKVRSRFDKPAVYPGADQPEAPDQAMLQSNKSVLGEGGQPGSEPSDVLGEIRPAPERPGVYPGAGEPATPDRALLQANKAGLGEGGQAQPEPSDALNNIPVEQPIIRQASGIATGGAAAPEASDTLGQIPSRPEMTQAGPIAQGARPQPNQSDILGQVNPPMREILQARALGTGARAAEREASAPLGEIPLRETAQAVVKGRRLAAKPAGRVVLTPEEVAAETQQAKLAKMKAQQRGMQYAAGQKPTQ